MPRLGHTVWALCSSLEVLETLLLSVEPGCLLLSGPRRRGRKLQVLQLGVGLGSGAGQVGEEDILMGSKDWIQTPRTQAWAERLSLFPVAPRKPSLGQASGDTPDCLVALNLLLSLHFQGL